MLCPVPATPVDSGDAGKVLKPCRLHSEDETQGSAETATRGNGRTIRIMEEMDSLWVEGDVASPENNPGHQSRGQQAPPAVADRPKRNRKEHQPQQMRFDAHAKQADTSQNPMLGTDEEQKGCETSQHDGSDLADMSDGNHRAEGKEHQSGNPCGSFFSAEIAPEAVGGDAVEPKCGNEPGSLCRAKRKESEDSIDKQGPGRTKHQEGKWILPAHGSLESEHAGGGIGVLVSEKQVSS